MSYLSLIKTPDVIIRDTSNGTKYAIATSTELKAIEKKHPKKSFHYSFLLIKAISSKFLLPHAVAMFITIIVMIAVITKAYAVALSPVNQ